jgi:predicted metal-dependent hydrolase
LRQQLGIIAALEHFFGYLGNWVLNAKGLDAAHADPVMLDLLRWHGAEEVEHRTVAFDIFRHMGGTYVERCFHMLTTILLLLYFLVTGFRFMYERDPGAGRFPGFIRGWWRGSRRGCLPSFWKMLGAALRYFRPSYTPHHEGSTEQALAYLATSPAAQAAAHGGNWVHDRA